MPEIIIEQGQDIINHINMLNLPYSEALRSHMANFVSGIITTEENILFLQFKKCLPVTRIGAAAQGFWENASGAMSMWITREFLTLLVSFVRM